MHELLWMLYAALCGVVGTSIVAFLMFAGAKYFKPESVHMTWAEWPILLGMCAFSGSILGIMVGYELAPLSSNERVQGVADVLVIGTLILIAQWLLRKVWPEPKAESWRTVAASLMWQMVSWTPGLLYYYWLGNIIRQL